MLKNDYSKLDEILEYTPYVLPPFPCGWYTVPDQYDVPYVFQFRRMPRAGAHTGKYGLFLKDQDAGLVLIGVVKGGILVPADRTYPTEFNIFLARNLTGRDTLTKRACAWCGRELKDADRLCHDSPKCIPKS